MARNDREMKEFIVLRRGPPYPEGFHYSLQAWELSRKAMLLEKRVRKSGKKENVAEKIVEIRPRINSTSVLQNMEQAKEERRVHDEEKEDVALKMFCNDVITVAVYEVENEEKKPPNEKIANKDTHVHEDRGDSTTKHPLSGPNTAPDAEIANQKNPVNTYNADTDDKLHDVAKQLCKQVICKAIYQVAKENFEYLEKTDRGENKSTDKQTDIFEQGQHTNMEQKPLTKDELKDERTLQRFQEEKVRKYIKMVNSKYEERNIAINKILRQQEKEEKKTEKKDKIRIQKEAKREEKQKKLKEKEEKKEKARFVKKEKKNARMATQIPNGEDKNNVEVDVDDITGHTANGKLGFFARVARLFRCR